MSQRTERVDELLRQEIGEIVAREIADPRVGFTTITEVETTPDLRHAKVWVSVIGQPAERDATIAALRCAELDEKQGHPDSAIRYYREALDNLADCDPEYLPWRTLAESGTKRLAAVSKARP